MSTSDVSTGGKAASYVLVNPHQVQPVPQHKQEISDRPFVLQEVELQNSDNSGYKTAGVCSLKGITHTGAFREG